MCGHVQRASNVRISGFGDAAGIIGLAGLITSRRQSEVGRHGARAFEPVGIIDCSLKGERRNNANARHAHQPLAEEIVPHNRLDLVVELQIGSIKHFSCVEQWQQSPTEHGFCFDLLADHGVVRAMRHLPGWPDTEHPEQAAELVFKVNTLLEYRLATGKQSPDLMTLQALYMDPAVPTCAQALCYPTRVILVCFVTHCGQRRVDLACLQTYHLKAGRLQAVGEVLRERAGLEPYDFRLCAKFAQARDDPRNLRGDLRFVSHVACVVHDANRDRPERYIQSREIGHLPLLRTLTCTILGRVRRAGRPPDYLCLWPVAELDYSATDRF